MTEFKIKILKVNGYVPDPTSSTKLQVSQITFTKDGAAKPVTCELQEHGVLVFGDHPLFVPWSSVAYLDVEIEKPKAPGKGK